MLTAGYQLIYAVQYLVRNKLAALSPDKALTQSTECDEHHRQTWSMDSSKGCHTPELGMPSRSVLGSGRCVK